MNKPEYEYAELFHLCLNEGMTVVALKSKALIGSQKYLILSGLVLLPSVILLAKNQMICFYLYQHLGHLISHHLKTQ